MGTPSQTPLKPLDFFILTSLLDDERHGYRIRQEVLSLSEGGLRVDAGNLYRALHRLLAAGLVERSARRPSSESDSNDERRRYYRLTGRGRKRLARDARRLTSVLRSRQLRKLLSETS